MRFEGPPASVRLPVVIGHRGAAARAPENTLAGLRCAKALGCTWVEFDVRLTADGVPVLCHDAELQRTTSGGGPVSLKPLATIRAYDAGRWFDPGFAGERVPTLEEALLLCADLDLGANVELKADRGRDYATAAAAADVAARLGKRTPRMLVSSFALSAVAAMRELAPQIPRGALFRLVPRDWDQLALRLGCTVIGADHRRLRRREVGAIRAAGYQFAAFTVNDPARARVLFDWGVTSVFSDAPDIILQGEAGHRPMPASAVVADRPAAARQGAFR